MTETMDSSLAVRVDHMEKDIADLKNNDKDIFREMGIIKESYIEMKFYSKQTQEGQANMEKKSEINQELVLKSLQELRDKPVKNYDQIKMAVWIFIATYIIGNIFGLMKIFTPAS